MAAWPLVDQKEDKRSSFPESFPVNGRDAVTSNPSQLEKRSEPMSSRLDPGLEREISSPRPRGQGKDHETMRWLSSVLPASQRPESQPEDRSVLSPLASTHGS